MSFLGEIKRRKVFQVAAVYAVVAWLIIQIIDVVSEPLSLPDWLDTVVIVLLAVGFPISLILSWAFDLRPEQVVRDEGSHTTAQNSGRTIEYALIGLLAVAVVWVIYRIEINPSGNPTSASAAVLPNSVAVLPFENLSPDPDNAYFAAGIHDTILNELAKISDMNVIARTSVLRYTDGQTPIAQIAETLNVETVMEGTVQYAEGQVRITAQLIDPETGAHLWSGNYDRAFADVFAIQSEIAERIAAALEAELLPNELVSIQTQHTASPEALALYLRALESPTIEVGVTYLDQAIAEDERFALAYVEKAHWLSFILIGVGGVTAARAAEAEPNVIDAANRALAIDPTLGSAHAALGLVHMVNWRGVEAEEAFQRAIALSPSDADVLMAYGRFKRYRGDHDEAIRLLERAAELDPNNSIRHNQLGIAYNRNTNFQDGAAALQTALDMAPNDGNLTHLALAEASRGNYEEASRYIELVESMNPAAGRFVQLSFAYAEMGRDEDVQRFFNEFERRAAENRVSDAWWAQAYLGIGDFARALERVEMAVERREPADLAPLTALAANQWRIPALDEPEFRALLDTLWSDQ